MQLTETALPSVDVSAGLSGTSGAVPTARAAQTSLVENSRTALDQARMGGAAQALGGAASQLASMLRMIGGGGGGDAGSAALGAGW